MKWLVTIIASALDKYCITAIEGITFRYPNFPLQWYERLGFENMRHMVPIIGNPNIVLEKLRGEPLHENKKEMRPVPSGPLKNQ